MNMDEICSTYQIEKPGEIISDAIKIDTSVISKNQLSVINFNKPPKLRLIQSLDKIETIRERIFYLNQIVNLIESSQLYSGEQILEITKFVSKELEEYEAQKYNQKKERLFQQGIVRYKNQEKSLYDKFEEIKAGRLSELEMLNFIEKVTDQYHVEKLKALKEDVEFYIFHSKEERHAKVTEEEIQEAIDRRAKNDMEIPYRKRPTWKPSMVDVSLRKIDRQISMLTYYSIPEIRILPDFLKQVAEVQGFVNKGSDLPVIDVERLIYPTEFFLLYKFKNLIVKKLLEVEEEKEQKDKKKQLTYGIHQENSQWLNDTFIEVEKDQPSQNKTVEKVRDLYKQKFELSIGKTTILRIVGRA